MSKSGMRRPDPKQPNMQEKKNQKKSGGENPPAFQGSKSNKSDTKG